MALQNLKPYLYLVADSKTFSYLIANSHSVIGIRVGFRIDIAILIFS